MVVGVLGIVAGTCLAYLAVHAWHDVQVRTIRVAELSLEAQCSDISLRAAVERCGRDGLACLDPHKTPRFVEGLGYAVLPREKYAELLSVVRASPVEEFDVDAFVEEIQAWRFERDGVTRLGDLEPPDSGSEG